MNTQTITPEVRTIETRFGPMKVASQRMFFNGTLCEVTITDNPDYWTGEGMKGMYKYQIWDTYAMLTSERDGMNDVLRVHAEELIIRTEMGDYRVRQARPDDFKVYGVNNWKGIYLESITISN